MASMQEQIDRAKADYANTVKIALSTAGEDVLVIPKEQLRATLSGLLRQQYPHAPGDELGTMVDTYLDELNKPQLHATSVQTRLAMVSKVGAAWLAAIVRAERANADERVRATEAAMQRKMDALKAAFRARDILSPTLESLFRSHGL